MHCVWKGPRGRREVAERFTEESDLRVGVGEPVCKLFDGNQIILPGKVSNASGQSR